MRRRFFICRQSRRASACERLQLNPSPQATPLKAVTCYPLPVTCCPPLLRSSYVYRPMRKRSVKNHCPRMLNLNDGRRALRAWIPYFFLNPTIFHRCPLKTATIYLQTSRNSPFSYFRSSAEKTFPLPGRFQVSVSLSGKPAPYFRHWHLAI